MITIKKNKQTYFIYCIQENVTYKDCTVEDDHKYLQDPFASHLTSVFFFFPSFFNFLTCKLEKCLLFKTQQDRL